MENKNIFINTIGCQMNVYDSNQIVNSLNQLGYKQTNILEEADLVIVNTCSIREKAEHKAISFLGRLQRVKKKKKDLIIGIGGCVAQQEGESIIAKMPYVDIVFGTSAIPRLVTHIKKIENKRCQVVDINMSNKNNEIIYDTDKKQNYAVSEFVTIMRGCDNFCSYCVVPYLRGRETSRPVENILNEIRNLVKNNVKEVTLLGQNVNSYGNKEGLCSFVQLLSKVNEIENLKRIRFITSHPKDFSDDIVHAINDNKKICNHIHLPVQSGADDVLKAMRRKYTSKIYINKIDKARDICPDIAISTDIIVGFPNETRKDFELTLNLIEKIEFDSLFAFIYSDRPNAIASGFENKVSEQEKKERLHELLDIQNKITLKKNKAKIGKLESVLIEGFSKKQNTNEHLYDNNPLTGRTTTNKIINFLHENPIDIDNKSLFTGRIGEIKIEKAYQNSLWGTLTKIID